jgi:hypothetical protein
VVRAVRVGRAAVSLCLCLLALLRTGPASAQAGTAAQAGAAAPAGYETASPGGRARVFSVASAAVAIGAVAVGLALPSAAHDGNQQQAAAALAGFMRREHAPLTHDVALATGPVLDAWGDELGLDRKERAALRETLEGSLEQGNLLQALDGPIDETQARRFAGAFVRVANRALGTKRTAALVERAILVTGV